MQIQRSHLITAASVALGLATGYLVWTRLISRTLSARRQVSRKLPIAKPLNTIPDVSGNYDIDGVSFDTEGVVVSGDANKGLNL